MPLLGMGWLEFGMNVCIAEFGSCKVSSRFMNITFRLNLYHFFLELHPSKRLEG